MESPGAFDTSDDRLTESVRAAQDRPVIVPLDGRETAMGALPVAREIAELSGADVHLVFVDPACIPEMEEVLDELQLPREQTNEIALDPSAGSPAEQIVAIARENDASFIVLCAHGTEGGPPRGIGATAGAVLEGVPCPVIFVPPARGVREWRFRSALIPHDGTPTVSRMIGPMVSLLRKARAQVWVVYVLSAGGRPSEAGALARPRYVDQPQHEWPSWIAEFCERFGFMDVPRMHFKAVAGEPGDRILESAREHEVDLIAVGWRGTLASRRAETLKRILAEAPVPVLIFRVSTQASS